MVYYLPDAYCVASNEIQSVHVTQLYPGRDTSEFDQGQVAKNQPITVLVLLSESLGL